MDNVITLSQPVIFTVKTPMYFDENFQPKPLPDNISSLHYKFHYYMLKEQVSGELKMFLMEIWEPWNKCITGISALRKYMSDNHLSEVITRGAGRICFEAREKTIQFLDPEVNPGLDTVDTKEVLNFSKNIWPDFSTNKHFGNAIRSHFPVPDRRWTFDELGCSGGFY